MLNQLAWRLSEVKEHDEAVNSVYLSLGTNIDPQNKLAAANKSLSRKVDLLSVSSIWSGPAIGVEGPDFFNAVVHIQSSLSMQSLKRDVLLKIERDLGRQRRSNKFAARPIDLDILIFNDLEIEIDIWRHAYLAVPLAEIHPHYRNPRTGEMLDDFVVSIMKDAGLFKVAQEN